MCSRLLLLILVAVAACSCARAPEARSEAPAGAAPAPEKSEQPTSLRDDVESMDAKTAQDAMLDATAKLGDDIALAAPDCEQARMLLDRICALSAHICRLAEKQAESAELVSNCEDGKNRCDDAHRRVEARCPR